MNLLFKHCLLCLFSVFLSCLNFGVDPEPPFINEEQQKLIRLFATENGYPETMPIDSFVEYLYRDWPYSTEKKDYLLTFPRQDTVPRMLVLSDVLTKIGKSLRVFHSDRGDVYPAYIDSISIRTDSVIILPALDLEDCHLTHLPPEIGKIRSKAIDISFNYHTLKSLPDELMKLSEPPVYFDSLFVKYDYGAVKSMNGVSDTLKNWLKSHAAPI